MSVDKNINFNTVKTNDGDIRIRSLWSDLDVDITIISKDNAWFSKIGEECIKKYANELSIPAPEYISNVRKYINDASNVDITVVDNKFIIYIPVNKMKMKYLCADLEPLDYRTTVESWLDEVTKKNKELSASVETHDNRIRNMRTDIQKCREIFQSHIQDSRNREKKLLSSFVMLLNTKKRRIQFLNEVIEANKYGLPIKNAMNIIAESNKMEVLSDSDTEYSTDRENGDELSAEEGHNSETLLETNSPPPVLAARESRRDPIVDISPVKKPRLESMNESDHEYFDLFDDEDKNGTMPATLTVENDITNHEKEDSPDNFCTQDILDRM